MAIRAGARIADLEFVQFHPTALAVDRSPMPLLTEALRGDGATLVDGTGVRFMLEEHADAELAPRDVVARAIWRQLRDGSRVFLDATALADRLEERIPNGGRALSRKRVRHLQRTGAGDAGGSLPHGWSHG